jgi:hypothetical protein
MTRGMLLNKQIFFAGENGQPFAAQFGIHLNHEGPINTRAEVIVYQDLGPQSKHATSLHDAAGLNDIMQRVFYYDLSNVRKAHVDFFLVQNIEEVGLIGRQYQFVSDLAGNDVIDPNHASTEKLEPGKAEALLNSIGIPVPESFA